MASVIQPPPPPPISLAPRAEERMVDEQIRQTRRSLKLVDLASGLITLVIGVLVFLLSVSVLEHWVIPGGWNGLGRLLLFVVMLAGIGWYSWRTFWPLVSQPINPAYAAQLIERSSPSLKNSLLNFLLLRNRRQQLSQKVYQAIEQQAAQRLSEVSLESVIDRTALLRLGYALVAVVAICALYRVLSPKNLTASMERVLIPWSNIAAPSRVEILQVTPGDTEIARGEQLEVSAEVLGLRTDEPVRVKYSTLDNQAVDREVLLSASEGGSQFRGRLPDRLSAGVRFSEEKGGGVQQDLEYWIEAGDARSKKYRVTVFARPTLVVEKVRYQFPAYTSLAPREVEGTGDISALEGTKVSVYALANQEIASANIDFGADGRHDLPMDADGEKASAQFTLTLLEDRRTPEYDSYVLQYKATNGRTSTLPPKYNIDVMPDYAPEVRILAPVDEEGKLVEQLDVPVDTPFTIEVEARDPDFALTNVVLLGDVAGEQVLSHDLLKQEQPGKYVGRMTATPQELNLKPGDILEYWAAAIDSRQPEPNVAKTNRLRIRVLGPPDFGEQGQGEQPGEGQGNQGEAGENGEGESGEQGEGLAGGAGEGGEQQEGEGQGAAGGQQGEGQSEGEQQGQEGQGGEGENSESGESASAGGEKGEGDQQGEQQSDPNGQGGDNPSQGQPGDQGKVSAEGHNDGEAFDRMSEHFAEEDADSQGEQDSQGQEGQATEGENQTEQSEGESETQSGQGDGEGSPDDQETGAAESGQNQDQGIDGSQEGEQSEGSGAEGKPNEQRPGEPQSSEDSEAGGEQQEKQEAPGGKMSTEQGEQGAGNNPGENEGSMDTDGGRKSRDKSDEGKPESEMNDQEAPGQANSQKESDSSGASGGDQSGGGQEGAGQQADAEGTGTAGENTAADDGGGQATEKGAGENSSKPGQQGEADKPTGESSEDKSGAGSQQSDQEGGSKPGGDQSSGEQPLGEPASAGGEQDEPNAGAGENGKQPPNKAEPTGTPGQAIPNGGGTGSNDASPPPPGELEPGDAANLDYAKKQTDLVLDRLDEQLKNSDVDQDLLEKLGWNEEELRQFVDRWKKLKAEVEAAPDEETKQELDNALRSLGLNPNRRTGFKSQAIKEKLRELQDSYRGRTPLEYADQVRAYMKGTATVAEEKD